MPFRESCWLKLESEICQEQSHLDVGTADPLGELKDLINVFVIQKKEVFTLSSLKSAYEFLN